MGYILETYQMTSQRIYQRTHPWITFKADLTSAPPAFWILLGEARSKVEHIAGSHLKPQVAEDLHVLYLARGVHATTAIEGNTLTVEESTQLVQGRLELPESRQYLATEQRNIVTAIDAILDALMKGAPRKLTPELVLEFNRQALNGLELESDVVPGSIRGHSVVVARYRGAPAEDCEYLLGRLCDWLNGPEFEPRSPELRLPYAIIKAVLAHLYLAWIHPFGDGNGRTARLIEVHILLSAGVPTPAAHLLSNHYNQTRAEYYRQLERASQSGGDVLPFLIYAVGGLVDGLREQLAVIRRYEFDDRWEQFVYETFGPAESKVEQRRRRLVLAISRSSEPVPRARLMTLTTDLALAYGARGGRTLARDIPEILATGLIEETPEGCRARKELIRAFLPVTAE